MRSEKGEIYRDEVLATHTDIRLESVGLLSIAYGDAERKILASDAGKTGRLFVTRFTHKGLGDNYCLSYTATLPSELIPSAVSLMVLPSLLTIQ